MAFLGASTSYVECTLAQIYKEKDDKGNAKRYYVRKLSEAKAFAQKLTDESACSCMPEDETGRIATPSGSCPEHGWMVGKPLIDVL